MRTFLACTCFVLFLINPSYAQSDTLPELPAQKDDILVRTPRAEYRLLPQPTLREGDILYEKRIWQVIDTREKINHPFRYPGKELITILMDAAFNQKITIYSAETEDFSQPVVATEVTAFLSNRDTVSVLDPTTGEEYLQIVNNAFDPEVVVRYRLKEVWYFDAQYSVMRVQILGIAPLVTEYDNAGRIKWEKPLFWVHFPESRKFLSEHHFFNPFSNDRKVMTWEDLFQMRLFNSYITKEGNVYNRRLQDYLSGQDLLLASEKIKQAQINYEHDLWSY